MKKFLKWLRSIFKQKCPDCGGLMDNNNLHMFPDGSEANLYECEDCKKIWI